MDAFLRGAKLLRCNLTIGYFSMPPMIILRKINDHIGSDNPRINREISLSRFYSKYLRVNWIDTLSIEYRHGENDRVEFDSMPSPKYDHNLDNVSLPAAGQISIKAITMIPENEKADSDVFQSFRIFPTIWWWLIAFQLMLFFLLYFAFNFKKYSNRFNILCILTWSLVGCIFSQSFAVKLRKSPRSFLFLLLVFIFFILAYFGAQFSTDLVVETKPFTIDKLDDFLDPRAAKYLPSFRKTSFMFELFEKSPSLKKQKIAQKCRKIGLDNCLFDPDFLSIYQAFTSYQSKPRVGIDAGWLLKSFAIFGCMENFLTMNEQNFRPYLSKHSLGDEYHYYHYSLVNDSCKSTKQQVISYGTYKCIEHGIFQWLIKTCETGILEEPHYNPKCEQIVDDSSSKTPIFIPFSNDKMASLFIIYACLMMLSLFVFIVEVIFFHLT